MYCQKCGLKLADGAGECEDCGPQTPSSERGKIGWIVIAFVLLTVVVFLLVRQTPETAIADGSDTATQAPPQTAPPAADAEQVAAGRTSQISLSTAELMEQVNPTDGFQLSVAYGDLGPQLLAAGAIDYDRFIQTYQNAGRPLTEAQLAVLTEGSDEPILINRESAYFLLNFFWAVGLTNENPLLTNGLMIERSEGNVGRFASTGGWTIGQKPATELYASVPLIALTPEQQRLVESVAARVYRPCCNNHTAFPDCNHGMAMLGLLELIASRGATEDEMFTAAKYMNAFWYSQQALETAVFFKATMDLEYTDVDGQLAVGPEVFSSSGFKQMHQWLSEGGALPQGPQDGNSCGV